MRAERGRILHSTLVTVCQRIRQTITVTIPCPVVQKESTAKLLFPWEVFGPMPGGCMTCTGTCMSGARIGMATILQVMLLIRPGHHLGPAGCIAAAAGTATSGTADQPVATTTCRASGSTTWAFALPGPRSFWIFTFLFFVKAKARRKRAKQVER
jgi:hypothetical protein